MAEVGREKWTVAKSIPDYYNATVKCYFLLNDKASRLALNGQTWFRRHKPILSRTS